MNYYNEIAKGYDELYRQEQLSKLNAIKQNILFNKKCSLLDIGCGTGLSLEVFKPLNYLGVDPSEKLLENKRLKYKKTINQKFEKTNINQKFDLILCITSFHHIEDKERALDLILNASHEKTRIVITLLNRHENKNKIKEQIFKKLELTKIIKEKKDDILILRKKVEKNE